MNSVKLMLAVAALLVSTACSGSKKGKADANKTAMAQRKGASVGKEDGRLLVVFFSHAGDNYAVGNVKLGNTKIVADYISELTGADQFEIRTSKYDGMSYDPLCNLAREEQEKGLLPPFEGKAENIRQYDTIFIGGPIWWGTYPQVMFTFFSKYDLNDKTLIPFTTHEGSGLGNTVGDVKKAYPQATVTGAFSIYGHEVRSGKRKVEKWLKKLGL